MRYRRFVDHNALARQEETCGRKLAARLTSVIDKYLTTYRDSKFYDIFLVGFGSGPTPDDNVDDAMLAALEPPSFNVNYYESNCAIPTGGSIEEPVPNPTFGQVPGAGGLDITFTNRGEFWDALEFGGVMRMELSLPAGDPCGGVRVVQNGDFRNNVVANESVSL